MRILIFGGPKCGKTTLAASLGQSLMNGTTPKSTDVLIGQLEWSDASAEVAKWIDEPGPWIVEGIAGVRALRKWMKSHPAGTAAPFDKLIYLTKCHQILSSGQQAMTLGHAKVWQEVSSEIYRRNWQNLVEFGSE